MINEEVGLKLDSVTMELLGEARQVIITKDETTIIDGAGSPSKSPADHPDPYRDQELGLRLRPSEAAGAAGQPGRWRRGDQGRCSHRGGAEGAEAPHRGRCPQRQGGCRRGHRRWRQRRLIQAGAKAFKDLQLEGDEAVGAQIVEGSLWTRRGSRCHQRGLKGVAWLPRR